MEGLPNELAHIVAPVPLAPGGPYKARTLVYGRHGHSIGAAPLTRGVDPPCVAVTLQAPEEAGYLDIALDYEEAIELSHALMGAASVIRQGNLTFWADEEGVELEEEEG